MSALHGDHDARRRHLDVPLKAKLLSVQHPRAVGAVLAVVGAAFMVLVALQLSWPTVLWVELAVLAVLGLLAYPVLWSLRNRRQAEYATAVDDDARDASIRKRPVLWLVLGPVAGAVAAVTRGERGDESLSTGELWVRAVAGLVVGGAAALLLWWRATRATRTRTGSRPSPFHG